MARMTRCDRCSKTIEGYMYTIDLPPVGWTAQARRAELCPDCQNSWKRLINKFMENK